MSYLKHPGLANRVTIRCKHQYKQSQLQASDFDASQASRFGAPAFSQARTSATCQRTDRPNRIGFGSRPDAFNALTCRTETFNSLATPAASVAKHSSAVSIRDLLMPAILRQIKRARNREISEKRLFFRTHTHKCLFVPFHTFSVFGKCSSNFFKFRQRIKPDLERLTVESSNKIC